VLGEFKLQVHHIIYFEVFVWYLVVETFSVLMSWFHVSRIQACSISQCLYMEKNGIQSGVHEDLVIEEMEFVLETICDYLEYCQN